MPQTETLPPLPDNVRLDLLPPVEAVEFFKAKGLKRTTDWRDLWQDEHARQFTVAKLARLDLLQAVHAGVDAAIVEGISPQEFEKRLTPILQKAGWWGEKERVVKSTGEIVTVKLGSPQRLALIYDVNVRTAYAAGRWQRMQDNKDSHGILVYRTMQDGRVRPLHRAWDGTALPIDHPLWQTHYPPNGFRCRCLVYAVDDDGLDNLKKHGVISEKAPTIAERDWFNRKTGETLKVPLGIDPGWAYNVGIAGARAAELQRVATSKLLSSANPLALEAVNNLVQSDAFARFFSSPHGKFPVAVLDSQLQTQLAAKTSVVHLSSETLTTHKASHPEIGLDDYRQLPDMVRHGLVIAQSDKRLVFFRQGKDLYKTVIKTTGNGEELFILTLFRVQEREIARELKRGKLIREWE